MKFKQNLVQTLQRIDCRFLCIFQYLWVYYNEYIFVYYMHKYTQSNNEQLLWLYLKGFFLCLKSLFSFQFLLYIYIFRMLLIFTLWLSFRVKENKFERRVRTKIKSSRWTVARRHLIVFECHSVKRLTQNKSFRSTVQSNVRVKQNGDNLVTLSSIFQY